MVRWYVEIMDAPYRSEWRRIKPAKPTQDGAAFLAGMILLNYGETGLAVRLTKVESDD